MQSVLQTNKTRKKKTSIQNKKVTFGDLNETEYFYVPQKPSKLLSIFADILNKSNITNEISDIVLCITT